MGLESLAEMFARGKARRESDAARYAALPEEVCQLCGAEGEDKRSLFIACLYAVHEAVPEAIDLAAVPALAESDLKRCYYLRVCKACRGAFLGHLRQWRQERIARRGSPMDHDGNDEPPEGEAYIPVRVDGALARMTEAQYEE